MQSQPFTLDYLCEFRQSDLQAAALDVRSKRYSGQPNLRGRLAARMAALVGRPGRSLGRTRQRRARAHDR